MALKKYKPITAGTRHRIGNAYAEVTVTKSNPEKSLTEYISGTGGRNAQGRRSMRYIGGGHKKLYRIIDFKRNKFDIPATVKTVEYDPNRSAFIALLNYADGEKRYIIAPDGIKVGQTVMSGTKATPEVGNAMKIKDIPLGTIIHNIELRPGQGGAIARSAGTYAQLAAKDVRYATIKLPSGETRMILMECFATIGSTSNPDHNLQQLGKAGRSRWRGIRPRNRAVAMNPVDHPMGGGEGKASGGQPRTRRGIKSRGLKTRAPKNPNNRFIITRRNGRKLS
ncbi:MAG: 50S ribosomal protein L2 [Chitinophagales bacterium]|jgi:large subunit ribosomal protein L2|nr:50S ribosomal protein L2 [Chitinophagales bacterium]